MRHPTKGSPHVSGIEQHRRHLGLIMPERATLALTSAGIESWPPSLNVSPLKTPTQYHVSNLQPSSGEPDMNSL